MAKITQFKGYTGEHKATIPRPETPPDPMIVTVQEGVPVVYPGCHGLGVRVVHPVNPNAPAKNMGLVKNPIGGMEKPQAKRRGGHRAKARKRAPRPPETPPARH